MPDEPVRTHVIMPRELVASIDRLVGRRARSRFLVEAAEEKLSRLRLARLAAQLAGSLADQDIAGWETGESAAEWVAHSRQADRDRLERLLQQD
jgi:hypothetical protein